MDTKKLVLTITLTLAGTSVLQAATIAANWWDNKTSHTNVTEELPAFPGSVRLGNGPTSGHAEGTIALPSATNWDLDFIVRAPGIASDPTDQVEIRINGILIATVSNNVPILTQTPINHSFFGNSLDYRFDFSSSNVQIEKHQFVLQGIVQEANISTPVPEPTTLLLLSTALIGLLGCRHRQRRR